MSRPTILFACLGKASFGELQNAVSAAAQIRATAECHFLVNSAHADFVRRLAFPTVAWQGGSFLSTLRRVAETVKPQLILVGDHHLITIEHLRLSLQDVIDLGYPIATFDSLSFAREQRSLTSGYASSSVEESGIGGGDRIVTVAAVPESVPLLRPVPIANGIGDDGAFQLYPETWRPEQSREEIRRRLRVPGKSRLVVFARARWARRLQYFLSFAAGGRDMSARLDEMANEWMDEAFARIGGDVVFFEVGRGKDFIRVNEKSRVVHRGLPFLASSDFDSVLGAADLYVTDNLISAAMARAARLGTPCLALVNETNARSADSFSSRWHAQMLELSPYYDFPFRVNPVGWVREIDHLLVGNPYLEAVPRTEIFDMTGLASALNAELGGDDPPASRALEDDYSSLPGFPEALDHVLSQR